MSNLHRQTELWKKNRPHVVDRFWTDILRTGFDSTDNEALRLIAADFDVAVDADSAYTIIMVHIHPYQGCALRRTEWEVNEMLRRAFSCFQSEKMNDTPIILLDQRIYATVTAMTQKDILYSNMDTFQNVCSETLGSKLSVLCGEPCSISGLYAESQRMQYLFRNQIEHEGEEIPTEPLVNRIKQYIAFHIDEPLGRSVLARVFYISPEYLSRIFREQEKISLTEYITNRKMESAMYMLINTDMPVYEIANKLGYHNFSYFSRVFKKRYNTTPTSYRGKYHHSNSEDIHDTV